MESESMFFCHQRWCCDDGVDHRAIIADGAPYPRGSLTKASRWQPRFPDYREIIAKSETLT